MGSEKLFWRELKKIVQWINSLIIKKQSMMWCKTQQRYVKRIWVLDGNFEFSRNTQLYTFKLIFKNFNMMIFIANRPVWAFNYCISLQSLFSILYRSMLNYFYSLRIGSISQKSQRSIEARIIDWVTKQWKWNYIKVENCAIRNQLN